MKALQCKQQTTARQVAERDHASCSSLHTTALYCIYFYSKSVLVHVCKGRTSTSCLFTRCTTYTTHVTPSTHTLPPSSLLPPPPSRDTETCVRPGAESSRTTGAPPQPTLLGVGGGSRSRRSLRRRSGIGQRRVLLPWDAGAALADARLRERLAQRRLAAAWRAATAQRAAACETQRRAAACETQRRAAASRRAAAHQ